MPLYLQRRLPKRTIYLGTRSGFTLIELIVVILLVSMMLLFSTPRLRRFWVVNETDKTARWIMNTVRTLRERSVIEQQTFLLNIDLDGQRLWPEAVRVPEAEATDELDGLSDPAAVPPEAAPITMETAAYSLPEDVRITDVVYPGRERVVSGTTQIGFYPQGHSGMALIHLEDHDGRILSLVVEPFLNRVRVRQGYVEWEAVN